MSNLSLEGTGGYVETATVSGIVADSVPEAVDRAQTRIERQAKAQDLITPFETYEVSRQDDGTYTVTYS